MVYGKEKQSEMRDFVFPGLEIKGVPIFVERREVTNERVAQRLSLEEAARVVRYQVMEEIARNWGATKIALGHTMNDQAETVLLNIFQVRA